MKHSDTNASTDLHDRAQALIDADNPAAPTQPTREVLQRLVSNLQVHQVELEMQSEELIATRVELERQRERYADFYDFFPIGFVSLNSQTRITQINLSGAQMLGECPSHLPGVPLERYVDAADRALFLACVGTVFQNKFQQRCEVRITGFNRQSMVVGIEAALSSDEQECRLVMRDITTVRATQDALQASEERLRLAMEASAVGLWDWDVVNDSCYFGAAYFEMLGYAPDALALTRDAWVRLVHPDDGHTVTATHQDCIENRLQDFQMEYRIKAKDGSWKWMLRRGKVDHRDFHGRALRMVGTDLDVTARNATDSELLAAKALAERANDAKSRFLAAASHDLRQPLAAMGMYVEVLKAKAPASDSTLLSNMSNCVSSLSELLTDLLDISKLDAGVVVPEVSNFSVADLLDKLVAVHAPQAVAKGLKLRCVSSSLNARTDPVLLRRILSNFIANAIRYTLHGGVLVGCRRRQGKYWIEVRDTGIGIAADKTSEIFEEFKQLERDERSRGQGNGAGGSGLGLAIVAKSSALLGLQVRVQSRVGRGSLFAIELPLGVASSTIERREIRRTPLRIALVDDNAIVLDALGSALASKGHRVVASATSEGLLALLDGRAPDVVVSDYRLANGATGYGVIAAVREKFGAHLPALLITGDTDPRLLRSMALQGIAVQHKPLDFKALQIGISRAVTAG